MDISVVIIAYNEEKNIYSCIKSVMEQDFDEEYEILVVDSSKDDTAKIVKENFPSVKLFHFDEKKLPGEAKNIGIEHARGKIIVFLEADQVPDKNWLRKKIEWHREGYVGVADAIKLPPNSNIVTKIQYITHFGGSMPMSPRRTFSKEVPAFLSYNKELFTKYGVFLTECYGSEDLTFNWRLVKKGEPLIFEPSAQKTHYHQLGFQQMVRKRFVIGESAGVYKLKGAYPWPPISRWDPFSCFLFCLLFKCFALLIRSSWCGIKTLFFVVLFWPISLADCSAWAAGYTKGMRKLK